MTECSFGDTLTRLTAAGIEATFRADELAHDEDRACPMCHEPEAEHTEYQRDVCAWAAKQ